MTAKQIAISIGFATFWAFSMIWWSSDRSIPNIVILSVLGIVVGFAWTWLMKRFGYIR